VGVADVVLMGNVEYAREGYGFNLIEGFGVLEGWYEGMKDREWVIGRERLEGVEKTGRWVDVLG
jgi:hypothetical protein